MSALNLPNVDVSMAARRVIYALVDPALDMVVYVGQTNDSARRERQYYRRKNVSNWVLRRWLSNMHQKHEFRVLYEARGYEALDPIEAEHIRYYKSLGQAVFNVKDYGCFGAPGKWSEDDRRAAFAVAGILDCFTPKAWYKS